MNGPKNLIFVPITVFGVKINDSVSFHCLKTKHSMGQFSGYQVQKQ
jgi:hypothetical protein